MAYAPYFELHGWGNGNVRGQFRHAETGTTFEYSASDEPSPFPGFETKVWVGDGFRWGYVLKTVAHIVVDEGPEGEPVVERWKIRGHREY